LRRRRDHHRELPAQLSNLTAQLNDDREPIRHPAIININTPGSSHHAKGDLTGYINFTLRDCVSPIFTLLAYLESETKYNPYQIYQHERVSTACFRWSL